MAKIGLFYGSDGGNTQRIAEEIAKAIGDATLVDVCKASKDDLAGYNNLILATPTYGSGELQSDWEDFLGNLSEDDFAGKTIALVGLGDQDTYSDTFCGGLAEIYNKASKKGKIIGQTSTDGYDYEESDAVVDGKFVGLVIDEDNQEDLTSDRIANWVKEIQGSFN